MPAQTRTTPTTTSPTAPSTTGPTSGPPDLTNGRGNGAMNDTLPAQAEDESSLLAGEDAAPKNLQDRAGDVKDKVTLSPGRSYVVSDADMQEPDPWTAIARNNGMSPANLQAFNQHVIEVDVGAGPEAQVQPPTPLAVGVEIYLPSAQELGFAECRKKAGSYEGAIQLWGQMTKGPNVKMLDAARSRASGEVGESYGTQGVDGGKFYTPNAELAGASKKNSKIVGGQREYAVFWLPDFWKCSIFMNDTVWQAGYKPALTDNKHYSTAGRAHQQPVYKQVKAKDAMPGDCFQRFGGTGSDQSHNTVLSTFVSSEPVEGGLERWTFSYIGAESERAAEAEKEFVVDPATAEVKEGGYTGTILRFLRPAAKR
jgi:hypothetical protein